MSIQDGLLQEARAIIDGDDLVEEKMQKTCELLNAHIDGYDWVGFYVVDPDAPQALILGPYAGAPSEHTRIPFGQGVCGQVAQGEVTLVVDDVTEEKNYLACSLETASEIVLPIFTQGKFVAQLDIDSHQTARFTNEDRLFLEEICMFFNDLI